MRLDAVAILRPVPGQCLRRQNVGILSIRIWSSRTGLRATASRPLVLQQLRQQSTVKQRQDNQPPQRQPKPTFGRFLRRAMVASLRNAAYTLSPRGVRAAYNEFPVSTVFFICFFIVFMGYVVWWLKQWRRMFYAPEFNRLPQPVRNTLRRAILNGFYKPDDKAAYKFFQQALRECQELKMDPFSDEVLGIRITVLGWLERIQNYPSAAIVVEGILSDLNQWIANLEQCEKEGKIDETGHLRKSEPLALEGTPHPASQDFPPAQVSPPPPTTTAEPPRETLWHKRQRLLSKAISAAVKLGELYASEHMMETEKAHKHLRWAVETQLKEFQRRRTEGLKPGEEDTFMSPGEVGGSMESLGRDYERQGHFQYAITLFFQSLQLCDSPCHRPVIMNNLAAAFAQQPLLVSTPATVMDALENISSMPMPSTRKECLDAALNWVNNAYTHANDVKGSDRTPECDQACAVALCNWGDIAALMGKRDVAYKKYKQCIELSQKLNFTEGVTQAEEGMFKLDKQPLEQTSSP